MRRGRLEKEELLDPAVENVPVDGGEQGQVAAVPTAKDVPHALGGNDGRGGFRGSASGGSARICS